MKKTTVTFLFILFTLCANICIGQKEDTIYHKLEETAEFQGFEKRRAMLSLLASNFCVTKEFAAKFEEEQRESLIFEFIVEKDGSVSDIAVANPPGVNTPLLKEKLLKVFKSFPGKFDPGKINGEAVRSIKKELVYIFPESHTRCDEQKPIEYYSDDFQNKVDTRGIEFRNHATHSINLYVKYLNPQSGQWKTDKITINAGKEITISYLKKENFLFNFYNAGLYAIGHSKEQVYISELSKTVNYEWISTGHVNIYDNRWSNTY